MKTTERVKTVWDKLIGVRSSPYKPMDGDSTDIESKTKPQPQPQQGPNPNSSKPEKKNKEEKKEKKKKRKGWKRIRHAALMTCRYIGMGVSHMSPMSTYPVPDYTVDPVWWCNSVQGKNAPAPHWTTGLILNGW